MSFTNSHGGTKAYTQAATNYIPILFNNILHPSTNGYRQALEAHTWMQHILFNIIYQSPRRHQAPKSVGRAYGGSTFFVSFTNPHGGIKAYTQAPINFTPILFNNILHLRV